MTLKHITASLVLVLVFLLYVIMSFRSHMFVN